jgi:hypothetical protein
MLKRLISKLLGASNPISNVQPVAPKAETDVLHLAPGRGFTQQVVGESRRQDAFEKVMGKRKAEGFRKEVIAQLVFDDGNPVDSNAVGVLLDRYHVGFIPKEDARVFREQILAINPEELPVTCNAKVVGGWYRDRDDQGSFGIKLSLAWPLKPAIVR